MRLGSHRPPAWDDAPAPRTMWVTKAGIPCLDETTRRCAPLNLLRASGGADSTTSFLFIIEDRPGLSERSLAWILSPPVHQSGVVPHDQVAVDLLHEVQADADDDEQPGTPQERGHGPVDPEGGLLIVI